MKGIDVSTVQGKISWHSVASDGVEFAMIKASQGRGKNGQLDINKGYFKNVIQSNEPVRYVRDKYSSQAGSTYRNGVPVPILLNR